jgi:hypothetical protein
MLSSIIHDGGMIGVKRFERRVDLRSRVQAAKIALREWPAALPALWRAEQKIDVVLAARDLVEQVDVVNVSPPIYVIVFVPLPDCP